MRVDNVVFSLNEEDVQNVAMDYLNRELTEEELDAFSHKFTIYDWYEHVVCHIQSLGFEGANV